MYPGVRDPPSSMIFKFVKKLHSNRSFLYKYTRQNVVLTSAVQINRGSSS
jgi:hypothetical protein